MSSFKICSSTFSKPHKGSNKNSSNWHAAPQTLPQNLSVSSISAVQALKPKLFVVTTLHNLVCSAESTAAKREHSRDLVLSQT
jgi:hypothetical protein